MPAYNARRELAAVRAQLEAAEQQVKTASSWLLPAHEYAQRYRLPGAGGSVVEAVVADADRLRQHVADAQDYCQRHAVVSGKAALAAVLADAERLRHKHDELEAYWSTVEGEKTEVRQALQDAGMPNGDIHQGVAHCIRVLAEREPEEIHSDLPERLAIERGKNEALAEILHLVLGYQARANDMAARADRASAPSSDAEEGQSVHFMGHTGRLAGATDSMVVVEWRAQAGQGSRVDALPRDVFDRLVALHFFRLEVR